MGFLAKNSLLTIREKMGIRGNGNFAGQIVKLLQKWEDLDKKLIKQQSFGDQNAYFYVNGNRKALLTIPEKMGIRENGNLRQKCLHPRAKWDPISSRVYGNSAVRPNSIRDL